MAEIVDYRPLNGIGELSLDLDQHLWRYVIEEDDGYGRTLSTLIYYLFPGNRWVRFQYNEYEHDEDRSAPWVEVEFDEVERELTRRGRTLPPDLSRLGQAGTPKNPLDERDHWMYTQKYHHGKSLKEILDELACNRSGWRKLGTEQGVSQAIGRYIERRKSSPSK
jgi:hypothetical protein